jgi:glutamine cyclotransferase
MPTATHTPTPTPVRDEYSYLVVNEYPHDPQAFTQGLVFEDGCLYESTGLYGSSSLRQVALETGEILQIVELPPEYFGEGIAIYDGNKIAQLTWRSRVGFIYDKADFKLLDQFTYATEGWGLTYDGSRLIMSDGTSTLHYLDPETLEEVSTVEVIDTDDPVERLNELEYIKGEIYANVFTTDMVAVIDPTTGRVTAWIDLQGLLGPEQAEEADVLNGIAYDAGADRLFVTGKLWPSLFELELVPIANGGDH